MKFNPVEVTDHDRNRAAQLVSARRLGLDGKPAVLRVFQGVSDELDERAAWASLALALADQLASIADDTEEAGR